jgi:hypothetical protein
MWENVNFMMKFDFFLNPSLFTRTISYLSKKLSHSLKKFLTRSDV